MPEHGRRPTIATSTGWKRSIDARVGVEVDQAYRGSTAPLATLLPSWKRVPTARTTSASAITGSSALRSAWGPIASGWSSGIARDPRPTSAPGRRVARRGRPARPTPPPRPLPRRPTAAGGRRGGAGRRRARRRPPSGAWRTAQRAGSPTTTSPVAYWRSIGTSTAPGCGRPLVTSRAASNTAGDDRGVMLDVGDEAADRAQHVDLALGLVERRPPLAVPTWSPTAR